MLPSPRQIKERWPLSPSIALSIDGHRAAICQALNRSSTRFCMVAGPCSIHSESSALEFALALKELQKRHPSILFVMRLFIEKSRTAEGWKGFVYDPDFTGEENLPSGILRSRALFLEVAKLGIPIATEMMEPLLVPYFSDLISWTFVGARLEASPIHRYMASTLCSPVGFKNGIDGYLDGAKLAVKVASKPQKALSIDEEGRLSQIQGAGNKGAHLVFRGSFHGANYERKRLLEVGTENKPLIDCSHGNAEKKPWGQLKAFESAHESFLADPSLVAGCMVEAFIESGRQEGRVDLRLAQSLTDPCLDLEALSLLAEAISSAFPHALSHV